MSAAAFINLAVNVNLAGGQIGKDRGTFQSTTLDSIIAEPAGRALFAAFLAEHRMWAAANGAVLINDFLNVNGGRTVQFRRKP